MKVGMSLTDAEGRIVRIETGTPAYDGVLKLWRSHSDTLGFMPEGGFADAARGGCLIGAVDGGTLVGYIMFRRTARQIASIVHLCVDDACRGKGVARQLFQAMVQRCGDCTEIRLRCRRDFEARRLWPRLGFAAAHEVSGRGKDAKTLTVWRYSINDLPLLRLLESARQSVVIDANVFFDLDEKKTGNEESRSLQADWLSEFIELCVTEEIYNEIDRHEVVSERTHQRSRVGQFRLLSRRREREADVRGILGGFFPAPQTANAESDLQQLTLAIACDAAVFATRDTDILSVADKIYDQFALDVMAPHEVVLHCDGLRREDAYRPKRLFLGPRIASSLATAAQLEDLVMLTHGAHPRGEKEKQTRARLRGLLAQPNSCEVVTVRKGATLLLGYALDRSRSGVLAVPFFASSTETLGRTAARHFLDEFISVSAKEQRQVVLVSQPTSPVEAILESHGFTSVGDVWVHFALCGILSGEDAAMQLRLIGAKCPEIKSEAERCAQLLSADSRDGHDSSLERVFWPVKLSFSELRNFVVPIRPRWAKDLFDIELAQGTLFGAQAELMLAIENVYYRASQPQLPTKGARILWYVSGDDHYPGTMAIRACSYVDEVAIGSAKEVFRKFRRLGVYNWNDVVGTAKGDPFGDIMAFRFSGTERFKRSVEFLRVQRIMETNGGRKSQFQAPTEVTNAVFEAIYRSGMCLDEN